MPSLAALNPFAPNNTAVFVFAHEVHDAWSRRAAVFSAKRAHARARALEGAAGLQANSLGVTIARSFAFSSSADAMLGLRAWCVDDADPLQRESFSIVIAHEAVKGGVLLDHALIRLGQELVPP